MGLLKKNQNVKEVTIYGVRDIKSDLYYRPVNISVDTNLCLCHFWMEGRRKNIHGSVEYLRDFTIGIDKKKDLFKQIYDWIKKQDYFKNCESL